MASVRLAELEDLFSDMKARFDRVCRLFCEDPATSQSDEFFGAFDQFISKKEEEEKIAKQHQEMRMRTLERKKSTAGGGRSLLCSSSNSSVSNLSNGSGEKNEFDDLISALRTGDVFGENMDKFKRNRKIRNSPPRVDRNDSFLRERNNRDPRQK
ncbi:DAAM [Lepeophtheirus salmonis]|uniref:DAAM n=1 Tax=Lepeophtheirus salmonis TaxID=72036 RepID=A0A7R8CNZ2_LEPSM|nr:DAAM [Lepeophtheirus salmonis]CAF2881313.1 DAAM [Lepeophtheirus salmonis]